MKKICLLLLMVLSLAACGGGENSTSGSQIREIALNETVTGYITDADNVHTYHFNAVEPLSTLAVNCSGSDYNSPIDFMVTIYEKDENGNLSTIFGESAVEGAVLPAELNINVAVEHPKHLYIVVRDFKDDAVSERVAYRLTISNAGESVDNNTFADPIDLQVGSSHTETIYPTMDVDCYQFTIGADAAGVYRISAQFSVANTTPMPVNLGIELYNGEGQLVQRFNGQRPSDNTYVLLPYLAAGDYRMVVGDQGSNDQSQYEYALLVEPVTASEVMGNDTAGNAEVRTPGAEGYTLDGSLEYVQDQDWYVIDVPSASGGTSQNIRINLFHGFDQVPASLQAQVSPAGYRVTVVTIEGEAQNVIHSHEHSVLATEPYRVEIAAVPGQPNYIKVDPIFKDQMLIAMPYQLNVQLAEVSDPGEALADPYLLTAGVSVTGKIFKLGDVDNYQLSVDTTNGPMTLEIYFDTFEHSEVTYTVNLNWSGKHRILSDKNGTANGQDQGDHFKAGFYLPQTDTVTTVLIQVKDDQNNDGSDVDYTLTAGVLAMATTVPTVQSGPDSPEITAPEYFSEALENAADAPAEQVAVIEYYHENQPEFKANTTLLKVLNSQMANNTWQSAWIAGFVDYSGDRDLFELDFGDVTTGVEDWYFDIQVHMYAPASNVEYSWTLFRDRQPNEVLVERTFWANSSGEGEDFAYHPDGEGIVACWADMDITPQNNNVIIPNAEHDNPFWIGDAWGDSRFYVSINDFNRAVERLEEDTLNEAMIPHPNQVPDNDWGNSNSVPPVAPYYFQVTVTYHPGCSSPDDAACAAN